MKCCICGKRLGKRNCERFNGLVCQECCYAHRNIKECKGACAFMQQRYERVYTNSVELTNVGSGEVICFSDSLFLPDVFECFYCNVYRTEIIIVEPSRIRCSTRFQVLKSVDRDVTLKEAYVIDSWKKEKNSFSGIPFLQIYTIGIGRIKNLCLYVNDIKQNVEIENNHVDTWLPLSSSRIESINRKEAKELYGDEKGADRVLTYYGRHFIGNNSTLFSDIVEGREYSLSFEILYDNPFYEDKYLKMPFGIFWPFNLVNYSGIKMDRLEGIEIELCSESMLMLPYDEKMRICNLMPLQLKNYTLSSPNYVSLKIDEFDEIFHYDRYCILFFFFKISLRGDSLAKAVFSELPILSGLYDSFNKVHNNRYAPVTVIIYNNSPKIEKYKVVVEILGLSHKSIKEVVVEPYKVKRVMMAPKLIEDRIINVRINTEYDIYVSVHGADLDLIYEETGKCLVYPREVFIDILKNKTKDWKLDLRSYLARWVTPTILQVEDVISNAGGEEKLAMRGASNNNNDRIQLEMKCIYDYLSKSINYVARTLSFAEDEYHTQKISLPSTTLEHKSGNCIDLTILLASCFEALKLHTYIVLVPGHAFLKVELKGNEIVYIESTYMGNKEYHEAVDKARDTYNKYFPKNGKKHKEAYEVDIGISRNTKILPME